MADGIVIDGLDGLDKMLGDIAPRQARNLNRATIHAVAGVVRDEAKRRAPKDSGTLRKAIKSVRRRPRNPDAPYSDVMVEHGRNAKNDAFYWRFKEYGTVDQPATPFIGPAADMIRGQISSVYRQEFMRKYAKFLERQAKGKRGR